MASKASKRVVEKGFAFKPKGGAAAGAGAAPASKAASPAAEASRLSGTKRRGNTVGFAALDEDEIRDVTVEYTPATADAAAAGPHRLALALALSAVKDYTAAVKRRAERQPPYFASAMGVLAEEFERDAPRAVAVLAPGDDAAAGFRNPKNVANARRLAALKQQLALYEKELAQWSAAAMRHGPDAATKLPGVAAGAAGRGGKARKSVEPPAAALASEEGEGDDDGEEAGGAPSPFLATALSTALTLDRVAQRLAQTGAIIDEARAHVKSVSLVQRRDFEADEGGAAVGAAAIKSLLKGNLMATATAPPLEGGALAPEPPTRTPRRLPPSVLAAAVASAQAQQQHAAAAPPASAGGKMQRSGKRGGAAGAGTPAAPALDARQLLATPGDGTGGGRPSVPDATPRIVGLIRKGKVAQAGKE